MDGKPSRWAALRKSFLGLDEGGLLDDFASPSAGELSQGRGLRPTVSTAREAAPGLGSTATRVSPLDARPVSLAISRSRAAE